jgi:pilus assembly protein FimV
MRVTRHGSAKGRLSKGTWVRLRKGRHFKLRKLALAVAVAMASGRLYALGLGDIELHSALNEPLSADVPLLGVQAGELDNAVVRLAPNDEFRRADIERPAILSDIDFTIVRGKDGSATVNITSKQPIREPFLDFIVQLSWQSGRLLREYTLLLDPPVFGEEKKTPVAAPVTETPAAAQAAPAKPPAPTPMATPAPAPSSAPRQAPQSTASAGTNVLVAKVKHEKGETTYGPIERNDTLWNIATSLRPDDSVSVYQMMMALLKENPQAFYDNNVNSLKAGYILRVPDKSVVAAIDERQAEQEAARQYQRWLQERRGVTTSGKGGEAAPAAKSGQEPRQTGAASQEKETARLRLVAPGEVSAESAGAAGGVQNELDKLRSQLAIAMESSDTAKRESEELQSRVAALEDQINSLQRLLTLKDQALNDLQKRSGMTANLPPAESTTPSMQAPSVAPATPPPAKPAPVKPAAPKAKEPADIFSDPTLMGAVAGAVVLLLAVLWLIIRRRRNDGEGEPIEDVGEDEVMIPPVAEEVQSAEEERVETPLTEEPGDDQQMTQVAEEVAQGAEEDITQAASDLDVLHTPEGDIDPIVEADVYLAYRRYQQAESLVQGALAKQPGRHDLQAKLLEIYYAARNADAFQNMAQSLYEGLGGNPEDATWQRILPMGRELCPDHPLFKSSTDAGDSAGMGALPDEETGHGGRDEPAVAGTPAEESFDLNLGGESGDSGLAEGVAKSEAVPQAEDTELDLSLGEEFRDEPASAAVEEPFAAASEEPASRTPAEDDKNAVAEAKEESETETAERSNSWEVEPAVSDFGNIDFGLDDADLLAGTDVVGTKLDLARAYIDMGDNDSARDILTEVIEEGNEQQKQEAKGLVEKIA